MDTCLRPFFTVFSWRDWLAQQYFLFLLLFRFKVLCLNIGGLLHVKAVYLVRYCGGLAAAAEDHARRGWMDGWTALIRQALQQACMQGFCPRCCN